MSKVYGDIELEGGAQIVNLSSERVENDPTLEPTEEGIIIYNTTENAYKYNNGSAWVTFEVSTTSSNALIETLGDVWINDDFSFNPTPFNDLDNLSGLVTDDSLFSVIEQLDAAITTAKTVVTLQGVNLDFVVDDLEVKNIIFYDGNNFVPGTINDLDNVDLNLSGLQDTTITDPENNQRLVYQSNMWTNVTTDYMHQDLSGTVNVFVVEHTLGTQFCNVTVIDMSGVTPTLMDDADITSIAFDSSSQLTVTTSSNKQVTILVSGIDLT